jgi:hypothetical protein
MTCSSWLNQHRPDHDQQPNASRPLWSFSRNHHILATSPLLLPHDPGKNFSSQIRTRARECDHLMNRPNQEEMQSPRLAELDSPQGWYLCPTDYRLLAYWDGQDWSGALYPLRHTDVAKARQLLEEKFGIAIHPRFRDELNTSSTQTEMQHSGTVTEPASGSPRTESWPFSAKQTNPDMRPQPELPTFDVPSVDYLNGNLTEFPATTVNSPFSNVNQTLEGHQCRGCGTALGAGRFCTSCGVPRETPCTSCGTPGSQRFCTGCGARR